MEDQNRILLGKKLENLQKNKEDNFRKILYAIFSPTVYEKEKFASKKSRQFGLTG